MTSKTGWVKRETVSLETLKTNLPDQCYTAIENCDYDHVNFYNDYVLHNQYFDAEPVKEFTDKEKEKLSEELGISLITKHYTSEELRKFLDLQNQYSEEIEVSSLNNESSDLSTNKRKK